MMDCARAGTRFVRPIVLRMMVAHADVALQREVSKQARIEQSQSAVDVANVDSES